MRKARHFLFTLAHLAVAISLLTGLALAGDQANIPPREDYSNVAAALKALIGREMEVRQLPAFSIALVDGGEIVWAQGFGHQDADRKIPATALELEGFTVYPYEWWHFDYKDWQRYPILNLTFEQLSHSSSAMGNPKPSSQLRSLPASDALTGEEGTYSIHDALIGAL